MKNKKKFFLSLKISDGNEYKRDGIAVHVREVATPNSDGIFSGACCLVVLLLFFHAILSTHTILITN